MTFIIMKHEALKPVFQLTIEHEHLLSPSRLVNTIARSDASLGQSCKSTISFVIWNDRLGPPLPFYKSTVLVKTQRDLHIHTYRFDDLIDLVDVDGSSWQTHNDVAMIWWQSYLAHSFGLLDLNHILKDFSIGILQVVSIVLCLAEKKSCHFLCQWAVCVKKMQSMVLCIFLPSVVPTTIYPYWLEDAIKDSPWLYSFAENSVDNVGNGDSVFRSLSNLTRCKTMEISIHHYKTFLLEELVHLLKQVQ